MGQFIVSLFLKPAGTTSITTFHGFTHIKNQAIDSQELKNIASCC